MNHTCQHCSQPVATDDACVCACGLTPGVHIVCTSCLARRSSIATQNMAWLSPLNRERLARVDRVRGPELIRHAARGNA